MGLIPRSAKALADAGYGSLTDLAGVTQEQLAAIPGVGAASLEVLEEALGGPLPRERKARKPPRPTPPKVEETWRKRGLSTNAAITFVQTGMTLERLRAISREELLGLHGVGAQTLHACEQMIGRKIPSRKIGPAEAFWRSHGLPPKAGRVLSAAGIGTLEDLQKTAREDLLALRGFGEASVQRLEAALGHALFSRTEYWLDRGLDPGIANALVREDIQTLADLARLSREEFLGFRGLGRSALWKCEKLLGHKLPNGNRP